MAAPPPLVCQTIGIPTNFIIDVPMGMPGTEQYVLSGPLPFAAFDAVCELARRTDTPDAFLMPSTWARTTLASSKHRWTVKPAYAAELAAIASKWAPHALAMVENAATSLHFKREKGLLRNPAAPQHDIVMFCSHVDNGARWFDATASDAPVMTPERPVAPERRAGCFWLAPGSDDARQAVTCTYCVNRSPARHLFKCSRCCQARYCTTKCQRADWPVHKRTDCRPVVSADISMCLPWYALTPDEQMRVYRDAGVADGLVRLDSLAPNVQAQYQADSPTSLASDYLLVAGAESVRRWVAYCKRCRLGTLIQIK